jgi:hypothetical protein
MQVIVCGWEDGGVREISAVVLREDVGHLKNADAKCIVRYRAAQGVRPGSLASAFARAGGIKAFLLYAVINIALIQLSSFLSNTL